MLRRLGAQEITRVSTAFVVAIHIDIQAASCMRADFLDHQVDNKNLRDASTYFELND